MKITYYGHAFFVVEGDEGPVIAVDPFDDSVGYAVPAVTADVVLASHDHFDHANVGAIGGYHTSIVGSAGVGTHEVGNARVLGVRTRHYDDPASAARGDNTVYVIDLDGIRVCHCGDLGHALDDETARQLGRVDVLMVPVGGYYTLAVEQVDGVVEKVGPRVVIPMHYRTEAVTSEGILRIAPKETWLAGKDNVRDRPSTIALGPGDLPAAREVWAMAYAG